MEKTFGAVELANALKSAARQHLHNAYGSASVKSLWAEEKDYNGEIVEVVVSAGGSEFTISVKQEIASE